MNSESLKVTGRSKASRTNHVGIEMDNQRAIDQNETINNSRQSRIMLNAEASCLKILIVILRRRVGMKLFSVTRSTHAITRDEIR